MSLTQPAKIQIDVMRLCEEVQRCPCLYDGSLTHNRDVEKDSNLWREIAKNLGVSESVCWIKWKSLRDKFVKTRKRLQLKRRNCATLLLLPIYIPWWAGYSHPAPENCWSQRFTALLNSIAYRGVAISTQSLLLSINNCCEKILIHSHWGFYSKRSPGD